MTLRRRNSCIVSGLRSTHGAGRLTASGRKPARAAVVLATFSAVTLIGAAAEQAGETRFSRFGSVGRSLSEREITQIAGRANAAGERPWLVLGFPSMILGVTRLTVYLQPDVTTEHLHRGRILRLTAKDPPRVAERSDWTASDTGAYAYVPLDRPPREIADERDLAWPFAVEGEIDDLDRFDSIHICSSRCARLRGRPSTADWLVLLLLPPGRTTIPDVSPARAAMDQDAYRIRFDGTLDDSVDETLRWIARSPTLRAQRRRAAWVTGGCCAAAVLVMVFMRTQALPVHVPASVWVLTVVIALTVGIAAAYAYGLVDRSLTRNRCRKLMLEHLGGKTEFPVTIALLPEGVSVTQDGAHSTLSWTIATGVEDTGDGIELSFVPGFVVAPNRAFNDSTERARFLTRARAFAKGTKEPERDA